MKPNHISGGQELLCINTEKVYDWIFNEETFEINLAALTLPIGVTCDLIDELEITCNIIPQAVEILDREDREFVIDGVEITLQLVTIRKTFEVEIEIPVLDGVEVIVQVLSRTEQVILCAPEGTDINVEFTEEECTIVSLDCDEDALTLDIALQVRLCQSIQSVFDVTLELVADFCQPREQLELPPCPVPEIPPQCPVIFPNNAENGF
ncbi:hypothetical protein [Piscibacillus halophilus]|uniref:SipL SPOCS domain-containing protein n=1 Tax=Piscibacillus halophilus TaxID=571933 RepID=A0A1H9HF54_9BACI|nr:hypothetical protein [Piscibacillus halophilus]SEQ60892.1 hypothetical protein SAMN05216362_1192 [Piscibacillus halophilus]